MTTLWRWALFLCVASLLLPGATAAEGSGSLEAAELVVEGAASLAADAAYLSYQGPGLPTLQLDARSIHIERIGTSRVRQDGLPVGGGTVQTQEIAETADFAASRVTLAAGQATTVLGLAATGRTIVDAASPTIRPVGAALIATDSPTRDANSCVTELRCIGAHGVYALPTEGSTGTLAGDIKLILHGPTLTVTADGTPHSYSSGERVTGGTGPVTTVEDTWLVVTAKSATGTIAALGGTWFVASPHIEASSVSFAHATGALNVGLFAYRAAGETLTATGALVIDAAPPASAASWGLPARDGTFTPAYASSFHASVSGDVRSVNLRASPVFAQSAPAAVGLAATLAALVAGLAYFWPKLTFGAASLYTRLRQPQILDNQVRNSIFEIIRANPGISARAVHRHSDQSWGTVVYHLRQLERHHLVVSRSVGRTRNYYENHGKYRGMEVQLACLQSTRARALARIVLAAPGISQEDLVTQSGFPQPTTSYYVRKLKGANLIEERREGRYARYHPVGDLGRFLELADSTVTPTIGLADAGVEG